MVNQRERSPRGGGFHGGRDRDPKARRRHRPRRAAVWDARPRGAARRIRSLPGRPDLRRPHGSRRGRAPLDLPAVGPARVSRIDQPDHSGRACRADPGDPLHNLAAGQPIRLVTIEFATRGRVRVNGTLSAPTRQGFRVDIEQACGNYYEYIQQRVLTPDRIAERPQRSAAVNGSAPTTVALIRRADTFFIGTSHPSPWRGRLAPRRHFQVPCESARRRAVVAGLHGNNMFNTLGNPRLTRAPRCCCRTSAPARRCSCPARPEWSGQHRAQPVTTTRPAGSCASPRTKSSRAGC